MRKKWNFQEFLTISLCFLAKKRDFFSFGINLWYLKCNMYSLMWVRKWLQVPFFRRWIIFVTTFVKARYGDSSWFSNFRGLIFAFQLFKFSFNLLGWKIWEKNRLVLYITLISFCHYQVVLTYIRYWRDLAQESFWLKYKSNSAIFVKGGPHHTYVCVWFEARETERKFVNVKRGE